MALHGDGGGHQKVKRGKKEKKKKTRKDDGRAWRGLEKVAHNGHGP